jgi:hypothetical protein
MWRANVGVMAVDAEGRPQGPSGRVVEDGVMVGKAVIVLVAFPVLVHASFSVVRMLLGQVLPPVAAMAGSESDMLGTAMLVAAILLAVRFAFGVCRRLWPTPAVR